MTSGILNGRRGARRLDLVPKDVLVQLNKGVCESVNLMEWLAVDMYALARSVFQEDVLGPPGGEVLSRVPDLRGAGVTRRLGILGSAVAEVAGSADHPIFALLSRHRSDIVRQWAVYGLNLLPNLDISDRLLLTRPFAADSNMSVRECAWMAFRPHLATSLATGLEILKPWVHDPNPNIRRFAVEVTRPRSVWGRHLNALKKNPQSGRPLLEPLKSDPSHYVRTAVANWLNDAWKTAPAWVEAVCKKWQTGADKNTAWVIRRALRGMDQD